MHMRRFGFFVLGAALSACGGSPVLSHLPRPDPAVVAAIAAGAAGAATLADPAGAARLQELKEPHKEARPLENREIVPLEVLDRADEDADATEP